MTQKLLGCCSKACSWTPRESGVLAPLPPAHSELDKYPASAIESVFWTSHLRFFFFFCLCIHSTFQGWLLCHLENVCSLRGLVISLKAVTAEENSLWGRFCSFQ